MAPRVLKNNQKKSNIAAKKKRSKRVACKNSGAAAAGCRSFTRTAKYTKPAVTKPTIEVTAVESDDEGSFPVEATIAEIASIVKSAYIPEPKSTAQTTFAKQATAVEFHDDSFADKATIAEKDINIHPITYSPEVKYPAKSPFPQEAAAVESRDEDSSDVEARPIEIVPEDSFGLNRELGFDTEQDYVDTVGALIGPSYRFVFTRDYKQDVFMAALDNLINHYIEQTNPTAKRVENIKTTMERFYQVIRIGIAEGLMVEE